jgi:hypothetical protein
LSCFRGWPPGHSYEAVQAFDEVAGRWVAGIRCAVCGRARGLRIGEHQAIRPSSPLQILTGHVPPSTGWIPQVRNRGVPGARLSEGVEIRTPDGRAVAVRRVRVVAGAHAGRELYRAESDGRVALAPDLARALGSVAAAPDRWAESVARELGGELPA